MRPTPWGVLAAVVLTLLSASAKGSTSSASGLGAGAVSLTATSSAGAEQRTVTFFFSAEAWGGTPFSVQEKQEAMARAMLASGPVRLEKRVVHLITAQGGAEAHVRNFTAVFEVDAGVRPPRMRTGYELELSVPRLARTLEVELVNGETGVVNIVRVDPDGAL